LKLDGVKKSIFRMRRPLWSQTCVQKGQLILMKFSPFIELLILSGLEKNSQIAFILTEIYSKYCKQ